MGCAAREREGTTAGRAARGPAALAMGLAARELARTGKSPGEVREQGAGTGWELSAGVDRELGTPEGGARATGGGAPG